VYRIIFHRIPELMVILLLPQGKSKGPTRQIPAFSAATFMLQLSPAGSPPRHHHSLRLSRDTPVLLGVLGYLIWRSKAMPLPLHRPIYLKPERWPWLFRAAPPHHDIVSLRRTPCFTLIAPLLDCTTFVLSLLAFGLSKAGQNRYRTGYKYLTRS
jgi:hypothetical protein